MKYLVYALMAFTIILGAFIFACANDCSVVAYMLGGLCGYLHNLVKKQR